MDRPANEDWPHAACGTCREMLPIDAYSWKEWEQARANRTAHCLPCTGGGVGKKRKLEAERQQKYHCVSCKTHKMAEAFPRAQLAQEDAGTLRKCLTCLQARRAGMQCSKCSSTKALAQFEPEMVTMPADGIVCLVCQEDIREQPPRSRAGFFSCKTCGKVFSAPAAASKNRTHRCLNCGTRSSRTKGLQTCRNQQCKRKWAEEGQPADAERQRYCPACRAAD